MSEQYVYLFAVKYRGAINISFMRTFTSLESLKEHWEKRNSWDSTYVYQFVLDGEATLLTEKKLKELFK
jgi:hypothetical protein